MKHTSRRRRSRKSRKIRSLSVLVIGILAAASLSGILIYGMKTGQMNPESVEASDTDMVSTSVMEAQQRAAEQRAADAKANARAKAQEKAAREAEEAQAKKDKEAESQAQKAESALVSAHPEMKANITLQLPTGDVTINRRTVQSWETHNPDGTWTKDEDTWNQHIADYVADMASKVDTLGKPHTFNATGIGQIEVDGNEYYGWQVDQAAEISQLTQELNEGKTVTREPNYTSRECAKADDNGGIGQSYCEVDASRQHLWIYKDGALIFETDVVTGLMDESHYTPEGVYLLLDKQKDTTLKGEQLPDGTRTYETPVSFWMPITHTGIGLHDAWWKSVFGPGQNEWNGSHGCINLPADVAETVYNDLTMDMPVVVYYSEAYELREAPPSAIDQYLAAQQAAAEAAQQQAAAEQAANADSSETAEDESASQTDNTNPAQNTDTTQTEQPAAAAPESGDTAAPDAADTDAASAADTPAAEAAPADSGDTAGE